MPQSAMLNRFSGLLLITIYLFALSLTPRAVFWSPDEGAKFLMVKTLQHAALPYRGVTLDPTYRYYPQHPIYPHLNQAGQVEFHWSAGFAWLSLLPFYLFGLTGLYLWPLFSGLAVAYLSGRLAERLQPGTFAITMLLVGLTTPMFFYSLLFWEHTLVVLLALMALEQSLTLLIHPRKRHGIGLMVCLGLAVTLRLEMLFYGLALGVALVYSMFPHLPKPHRSSRPVRFKYITFWLWGAAIIIIALVLIILNNSRYLTYLLWGASALIQPDFWANSLTQLTATWISTSAGGGPQVAEWLPRWGLLSFLCLMTALSLPQPGRYIGLTLALSLMGYVSLTVLLEPNRYRTLHGFFLPAPQVLFGLWGAFHLTRPNLNPHPNPLPVREGVTLPSLWGGLRGGFCLNFMASQAQLVSLTTLLYLAFGTIAVMVRQREVIANLEWGPRYLLTLYPLMVICSTVGWREFVPAMKGWRYLYLGLAIGLTLLGANYQGRGWAEIRAVKGELLPYSQALAAVNQPIVTDIEWLYASLAPTLVEKEVYVLNPPDDLAAWVTLTENQPFVFASFFEPSLVTLSPIKQETVGQLTLTYYLTK